MPPNILDGNDLERGRRFTEICRKIFGDVANVEIGQILAGYGKDDGAIKGYSEGSIRRWKAGGPIGATALLNLQRLGVDLEYLLEGKQNTPPAKASGVSVGANHDMVIQCLAVQELLVRATRYLSGDKCAGLALETLDACSEQIRALAELLENETKREQDHRIA